MAANDDMIFVFDGEGSLVNVPAKPLDSEDIFQELIAEHPELLSGEQISPGDPVQWMLIKREAEIMDGDGAAARWALDHLLLDQTGRPTLVEVKRSTDTRIRREVVGQMLDYAANAQKHWPVDRIRAMASEHYGSTDEADSTVARLLGVATEDDWQDQVAAYWSSVEDNLRNGYLRLLFVADEIPRELRRIIEFLNEQMTRTEVLGIELRHYASSGVRAVVPRVFGQTESAREAKHQRSKTLPKTTPQAFLAKCPAEAVQVFQDVLAVAEQRSCEVYWGTKGFSVRVLQETGDKASVLYGYPPGAFGKNEPFLQAYLKDVSDQVAAERARQQIAEIPHVAKQGQGLYYFDLAITVDTVPSARLLLSVICELIESVHTAP